MQSCIRIACNIPMLCGHNNGVVGAAVNRLISQLIYRQYATRPTIEDGIDSEFDEREAVFRRDKWSSNSKYSRHKPRVWEKEGHHHTRIRAPYQQQHSFRQSDFDARPRHYGSRFDAVDQPGDNLSEIDWSTRQLEPVQKEFYVEHQCVQAMSEEEVNSFYESHDIRVIRGDKVKPVLDFQHANFPDVVEKYLQRLGWGSPTPVQSLGWPLALSGQNMVAIAQTGSGKTLGFVLPALVHVKGQTKVPQHNKGPVVLVLAPTRELAQQIKSVCVKFGRVLGITTSAIFGGQSKLIQAKYIAEGPEVVVATPGRLLDFLESGVISLDQVSYLVLDEADRMLDMGFEPQIRKILSQIRPDRQLLLWSATWPKEIQQLARDFLGSNFTQVNIGSVHLRANPNIEQTITVCQRKEKFNLLLDQLDVVPPPKTLIFVQTKSQADLLTHRLRRTGIQALSLHGAKSQLVRDRTLHTFKTGQTNVLVATDVASRGLDVQDIELVVNFDPANTADDYIHRIGRTARAQNTGRSLTFLTEEDSNKATDLIAVLTSAGQPVSQELQDLANVHSYKQRGSRDRWSPGKPRRRFSF